MHKTLKSLPFLAALALPLPALADACGVALQDLEPAIAKLEPSYSDTLSDISCDEPRIPAHAILCNSAFGTDPTLWRMARLDDMAWVYALENATGTDYTLPPLDEAFIQARDACTDEACLCEVLIQHTNDSLGGLSPYVR